MLLRLTTKSIRFFMSTSEKFNNELKQTIDVYVNSCKLKQHFEIH